MTQPVILFSGQGAQKIGMALDWIESSATARELARQADEALGYSLTSVMSDGPEESLTATSRCQPALYLHGMIGLALLKERLPDFQPAAAAGLSLGEFTAHAAAGTFSFLDGLKLVSQRGTFMEEACLATDGAMAALIGGEEEKSASSPPPRMSMLRTLTPPARSSCPEPARISMPPWRRPRTSASAARGSSTSPVPTTPG